MNSFHDWMKLKIEGANFDEIPDYLDAKPGKDGYLEWPDAWRFFGKDMDYYLVFNPGIFHPNFLELLQVRKGDKVGAVIAERRPSGLWVKLGPEDGGGFVDLKKDQHLRFKVAPPEDIKKAYKAPYKGQGNGEPEDWFSPGVKAKIESEPESEEEWLDAREKEFESEPGEDWKKPKKWPKRES